MIDLTIVIPHLGQTKEQKNSLNECLISLYETEPDIPIIVATNRDEPEPVYTYYNNYNRIHIYEQGQCKAVNAAIATVNTEWILISNDDMVYPPNWLNWLDMNGEYDCISPILVEPNNGALTFIKYFCGGAGGDFDKQKFLEYDKGYARTTKPIRTGFNMPLLIKRSLWHLVEGYDINYDPWSSNSDSDLEYKIKLAGIQPMQNTNCLVYHFSQTSETFHPRNINYWNKNFAYFEEKWGFPRTDNGIWEANFKIPYEKLKYKPNWMKT